MDSQESSGGGSATLYIIVFLLCVISAVVGYFQFTLGSQRAEAERKMKEIQTESERKMKEIQAKAEADMAAAKSEEEKREIERKAQIESDRVKMKAQADSERAKMKAQTDSERAKMKAQTDSERAKMKAQTDAEKKALANREAKIKAAEAAVNKKLADAAAKVRNAQNLQNQAKKVKTDADNKKRAADAAMAKAVASGKAVDKKLADEKKRIAADAARKVSAANKKAAQAAAQARAEANKALGLKKQYDQLFGQVRLIEQTVGHHNAVAGYPKGGVSGRVLDKGPVGSPDPRVCRDWAAREGFAMWGHRNDKHPNGAYQNTCFAYERVDSTYRGDGNDNIHMVGCTFSDLRPDQTACPTPKHFYRYVRIYRQKTYADHFMNLAGVDIISEGGNVAPKAKLAHSSLYPGYPPKNLVDGNMTTFAHTQNGPHEWFLFDLGQRMSIDKVVIWNRRDCCHDRARDIQVQLSNDGITWISGPKIRAKDAHFWRHQYIPGEPGFVSD